MSPAAWTAAKKSRVTKPSAAPMTTCWAAFAMRAGVLRSGSVPWTLAATGRASPTASRILTCAGMSREVNGGQITIQAEARSAASMIATRFPIWTSTSITTPSRHRRRLARGEQRRDLVEQLGRVRDHLVQHPVAAEEQRDADAERLGHEREGGLLDLRHALEQRDREPDQQRGEQDGRAELRGHRHGLQGDLDDLNVGHAIQIGPARVRAEQRTVAARWQPRRPSNCPRGP